MQKRNYFLKFLSTFILAVLIASFSSSLAKADSSFTVCNLNMVLQDDPSTSIFFSWRTAPVSSSSTPQLETAIIYCESSQELDAATAQKLVASSQVSSRTAYYKASLTGLKPGTTYTYAIMDTGSGQITSANSFTTAPSSDSSFSFLCLPDSNYRTTSSYQNNWGGTLDTALSKFPDTSFVMHTGNYGSSTTQTYWDGFFGLNTSKLSNIPFVPLPVSSGSSNQQFTYNFNLPSTSNNTANYSFVYGDALVLALNTNLTSTSNITAHATWIKNEVAEKGDGKWIIVAMGNSFYGRSSNTSTIKRTLEKTFDEVNVSLVLQGSDSVYARSHLVKNATILDDYPSDHLFATKDGVIYLVPGSAGAEYNQVSSSAGWVKVTKDFSASGTRTAAGNKTYSHITVSSETIKVSAYTVNGEEIDHFEINRNDTPTVEPRVLTPNALNNNFGSDPKTTRKISWQTSSDLQNAFIEIQDDFGNTKIIQGSSAKVPSILTSNNYHKVALYDLLPGTTYKYRVGNTYTSTKSNITYTYYSDFYQFKTEAQQQDSFNFIHMADAENSSAANYTNCWTNALQSIQTQNPDSSFIVHTGELVSSASSSNWNNFINATGIQLASPAFIPVSGYPEYSSSSNANFFKSTFNTEVNATGDYSFTYGNALILTLNTRYSSSSNITSHTNWIKSEVAAKGEGKWIIVAINGSFYGSSSNTGTIKRTLETVFNEVNVSLVLQGTDGAYIRSYLIQSGNIKDDYPGDTSFSSADGIIYSTPGSVGKNYSTISSSANWVKVTRNFSSSADRSNPNNKMYSKITVTSDAIQVTAYTLGGEEIDQFEINHLPTPEPESRVLEFSALNNAFGTDAKTTRSISWQTNNLMSRGFVEVIDPATGETVIFNGTSAKVPHYSTSRNYSKVVLSGLTPGATYQYRLGNTYVGPKSGVAFTYYSDYFSFKTEPETSESFTFLHMADSQTSRGSSYYYSYWGNTLQKASDKFPDASFIIHTGDMVDTSNQSQWEAFLGAAGTNLSSPAFMPVLGNHENSARSTSEPYCQTIFNVDSQNGFALNYSYTYGNALFINLNSNYTSSSELEKQKQWIINEAATKGEGKFIIISFHKAPFGGTHAGDSDVLRIKKVLVPVFEQIGADLVLQGHDHNYIRTYPIKNGVPNKSANSELINTSQDGVIYMMSRNSGEKNYSVTSKKDYMNVLWNYSAEINSVNATVFSAITVEEDKIIVTAYTSDYRVIDTYTLVQDEAVQSNTGTTSDYQKITYISEYISLDALVPKEIEYLPSAS